MKTKSIILATGGLLGTIGIGVGLYSLFNNSPVYDMYGYDSNGYDRDGYNRNGYDKNGRDRNGFNQLGYDKRGYDHQGFDHNGYDKKGYNILGYDSEGFDRHGMDIEGYYRSGYNSQGFNRDGYDKKGYNCNHYNKSGIDRAGYDNLFYEEHLVLLRNRLNDAYERLQHEEYRYSLFDARTVMEEALRLLVIHCIGLEHSNDNMLAYLRICESKNLINDDNSFIDRLHGVRRICNINGHEFDAEANMSHSQVHFVIMQVRDLLNTIENILLMV